jgi:uncharacterized protein with PIN domain
MADCPVCNKSLTPPTVKCVTCGIELHRVCAKHALGKWYCKGCYKKVKKQVKFEHMAQRAATFGTRKPGKVW